MTKPKFCLHIRSLTLNGASILFWTCSVQFPTPSVPAILHSGPCVKAASAIAEATFLMRQHLGRCKR